ncbi:TetR/AcrR family transcriptional regulator [uncultured Paenibacillus sp.]|uniref:TetR/AcrR family transcriptional regulator n=1 Tax=uncultured Paenibacillus sp. TaxID=227322 RepID=UPI0015AF816D|nr:TetR/AcrR family transcriptional regulator [uncultured Paenibacillus sp.]
MKGKATREHIINSADRLFYERGYEHTSFADIADSVQISKGNFYYYFKSKDEILDAVIQVRLENTRNMLMRWEEDGERPEDRIKSFIHILTANRTDIQMYGCPVGTLCTELTKLNHASQPEAVELFNLFRTWLGRQFTLLGREAEADELAMHLLARSQGVATLAQAFRDEKFIRHEIEQMCDWLSSLLAHSNEEEAHEHNNSRKGR